MDLLVIWGHSSVTSSLFRHSPRLPPPLSSFSIGKAWSCHHSHITYCMERDQGVRATHVVHVMSEHCSVLARKHSFWVHRNNGLDFCLLRGFYFLIELLTLPEQKLTHFDWNYQFLYRDLVLCLWYYIIDKG